jgi:osmotically-inducible protein OsmY
MGQSYGNQGWSRENTGYGGQGYGAQSGSHARMGAGNPYETTGYGYGGGYGGQMNQMGDREGYHYGDRGGQGYGERGGGFGGGMAGGQSYGGGVSSGRERDLSRYGIGNQGGFYGMGNQGEERFEGRDRDRDRMRMDRGGQQWSPYGQGDRPQGGHRGKGPAGYQRSDERIKEEVCQALSDDDHIDATHIEITVKSGEVTLSGHVNDRRTKRMAEDVVERIHGVKDVTNQIRVQSENQSNTNGNGRTSGKSESVTSNSDKDTDQSRRPRA